MSRSGLGIFLFACFFSSPEEKWRIHERIHHSSRTSFVSCSPAFPASDNKLTLVRIACVIEIFSGVKSCLSCGFISRESVCSNAGRKESESYIVVVNANSFVKSLSERRGKLFCHVLEELIAGKLVCAPIATGVHTANPVSVAVVLVLVVN